MSLEYVIDRETGKRYNLDLDNEENLWPKKNIERVPSWASFLAIFAGSAGGFFLRTHSENYQKANIAIDKQLVKECVKKVKSGEATIKPEDHHMRLTDLLPIYGFMNYIDRNKYNYWCIPELRNKIDKRKTVSLITGQLIIPALVTHFFYTYPLPN